MQKYFVGGSLTADDPTYIERQADIDLYQALQQGKLSYVLTARQTGKSSLRLRVRQRLEAAGGRCASIDVTGIGSVQVSMQQWYQGLAFEIHKQLRLAAKFDLQTWWQQQGDLSPVQIFGHFIEEILLVQLPTVELFILLDEIDSLQHLSFPVDDFFALIRFCDNQRAENPAYRRLTWALFGVANPNDLIRDASRTPFNIGCAIDLQRFTEAEAAPLAQGLTGIGQSPATILKEILRWTGGQPFLTQKLCQLVQASRPEGQAEPLTIPPGTEAAWVDNLVQTHLVEGWETHDEPIHFRTICDRILTHNPTSGHTCDQLLLLYRSLLDAGDIGITPDNSSEQTELRLSGLTLIAEGKLRIANPLYAAIFNAAWVDQQLYQQCPYTTQIKAWADAYYLDESRLLSGQALEEALEWATDKNLSDVDHLFLSASQDIDARKLEMEQESRERALMMISYARKKARRLMRMSYVSLVACLGMSSAVLLAALIGRTPPEIQRTEYEESQPKLVQEIRNVYSERSEE